MYLVQKKKILLIHYLSSNMKIIIAGYGFVGKAVHNALKLKHEIVIVDPKYTTDEIQYHHDADGLIICVNTPTTEDGICDVSNIANILDQVPIFMPVLVKSTITPSIPSALAETYENLAITYSPEFLRASTANQDFINQKFCVLGGEDPEGLWQDVLSQVLTECKIYFHCTPIESCTIKYAINSFLATKVTFFNQLSDLCDANGADFSIVRQIITHDSRIGNSHTVVPGLDGLKGFGGACFPKDTEAFLRYIGTLDTEFDLLETAIKYNKKVRKSS
jgi:UDPglucose 6-dehydrogenase